MDMRELHDRRFSDDGRGGDKVFIEDGITAGG